MVEGTCEWVYVVGAKNVVGDGMYHVANDMRIGRLMLYLRGCGKDVQDCYA